MSPAFARAASPSASSGASGSISTNGNLKVVGIILAICSGLLIGSSFVFKKKGLLRSQAGHAAGEGVAYLKSPLWWLGMSMMILGELCNFAAYAFVEAIVVTPLGALSVVVCAILSSIFLNEKLSFFGWLGCALCILGSVIIALNGPSEATVGHILDFQKLFVSVGFLVYIGILISAALVIIFYAAPRWGKKSMLWYIFVCSMIGGISVSVTTGLGASIVTTAQGDNQFKHWFIYFLLGFVIITLLTEVYYLNVALALFNTAMVTPTYYVIFTFFSIVTTIVLFKGLAASPSSIITLVMGFLVICVGITILQMSKVDPEELSKKLDRRSTILLQAARSQTESMEEKHHLGIEDPGMDTLRGSFGAVGSIIRARSARRLSQSSSVGRPPGAAAPYDRTRANSTNPRLPPVERHQLYDAPMPSLDLENRSVRSDSNATTPGPGVLGKRTTIKFGTEDVVHQYHPTGGQSGTPRRDDAAIHSSRPVVESPLVMTTGLPPADGGYPPGRSREETDSQRGGGLAGVGANGSNDLLLGELDEHPPPSLATHGSMTSLRDQSIAVSEAYSNESHMTRSAPPTMAPRFPGARRMDSRDIFSKDEQSGQVRGSPQSGTLLSFPSVTDSARSANWEDGAPSERGRSTRKYPRTGTEDDRDESVSLWNRGRDSPDDLAQDSGDSAENTIRLVQPRF